MAIERGTKGQIIQRWIGICAGLGLLGATGFGAWEFIQQQGGAAANPFDMALAGFRLGVPGALAGAAVGAVWGAVVAVVRG